MSTSWVLNSQEPREVASDDELRDPDETPESDELLESLELELSLEVVESLELELVPPLEVADSSELELSDESDDVELLDELEEDVASATTESESFAIPVWPTRYVPSARAPPTTSRLEPTREPIIVRFHAWCSVFMGVTSTLMMN
ncbi:hypothetical protein ACFSYH_07320 [Populibacterium corticicola]|uniref:Uncharacterized protein n=1 Tax=Populibacterium corticicola TaxID=1812826 RepID=A0ABW5XD09_9MICO